MEKTLLVRDQGGPFTKRYQTRTFSSVKLVESIEVKKEFFLYIV
jgi:hypothetical protein